MRFIFWVTIQRSVFVIKALIQERTLIGIVAHPRDLEDGVKYESVHDFGIKKQIPTVRGTPKDEHVFEIFYLRTNQI